MSTPIHAGTPPRPTRHVRVPTQELTEQMQRMIDLQNEQNEMLYGDSDDEPPLTVRPRSSSLDDTGASPPPAPARPPPLPGKDVVKVENSYTPNNTVRNFEDFLDPSVGMGTIFFTSEALRPPRSSGASLSSPQLPLPPRGRSSSASSQTSSVNNSLRKGLTDVFGSHHEEQKLGSLASYGAIESDGLLDQPLLESTQLPLQPTSIHAPLQQQQHDFQYHNPDFHYEDRPYEEERQSCCRVWLAHFIAAENLHRSFCYGAIDGMLTGSGILSAFCGMRLVDTGCGPLILVFTLAACFADSLCMAIGQVWTTHLAAEKEAHERAVVRSQFDRSKPDAKGQLVDMLLEHGMLKIDAMSLADTLEGYPDLFVNCLTGEALIDVAATSNIPPRPMDVWIDQEQASPFLQAPPQRVYSYGRLTEDEMDPTTSAVRAATRESRHESIFMMTGFTIFALVPALIFNLVIPDDLETADDDMLRAAASPLLSPRSMAITLAAGVMGALGIWKSRFVAGNWLVFCIETVVILLICLSASYGMGRLLSDVFLADYRIVVGHGHGTEL